MILGCSTKNQSDFQTRNRFQPCVTKMQNMPKVLKISSSLKDKVYGYKSSSSSEDERHHSLKNSRDKHFIEYNDNSESDDSHDERQHAKYNNKQKKTSRIHNKKKLNQQCDLCCSNYCNCDDIHQNEIQSCNIKDCCNSLKNKCLEIKNPGCTVKDSCTSSIKDYCNSCCYCPNCLGDIESTINHYRSNNLSKNSHYEPRRYPASWTPLHGQSCSPPDRNVKNACIIEECNDLNCNVDCNDDSYEGNCNVMRGGVAQKNTPIFSCKSEVSSYLLIPKVLTLVFVL